jgi:hypothetical protein
MKKNLQILSSTVSLGGDHRKELGKQRYVKSIIMQELSSQVKSVFFWKCIEVYINDLTRTADVCDRLFYTQSGASIP